MMASSPGTGISSGVRQGQQGAGLSDPLTFYSNTQQRNVEAKAVPNYFDKKAREDEGWWLGIDSLDPVEVPDRKWQYKLIGKTQLPAPLDDGSEVVMFSNLPDLVNANSGIFTSVTNAGARAARVTQLTAKSYGIP